MPAVLPPRPAALISLFIASCILSLAVSVPVSAQVDGGTLPPPDSPASHEKYFKFAQDANRQFRGHVVAAYDAWLKEHPGSVRAALERCKFLRLSTVEEEVEEADEPVAAASADQAAEDCAAQLAAQFPTTPLVLQFRLEQLWGDDAKQFGLSTLARDDIQWTAPERALFATHLAYQLHWQNSPEAVRYAWHARTLNPGADVSLIVASDYQRRNLRERAIQELMAPSERASLQQKVALLVELEAFREAFALIEAEASGRAAIPPLLYARILEALGKTEEARAKYSEIADQKWNREAVLKRLFYLDLAKANQAKAVLAYAALRDEGYKTDPLMRHRLALAWHFPLAPWSLRDLAGLAGLLTLALFLAALPASVVLPVHYVGVLRILRGTIPVPTLQRWNLRHLWLVSASLLLASALSAYLFAYDELIGLLSDTATASATPVEVARAAAFGMLLGGASVLGWLRRADLRALVPGTWSPGRSIGYALLCVVIFYFVAGLTTGLGRALGVQAPTSPAAPGMGLTTVDVMQALRDVYGPGVLFPLAALLVPLYEEIAFRSVFLTSVAGYVPFGWANVLQAAAFTLAHDQIAHFPALFALALMSGVLVRRSGGLAASFVAHIVINSVAVLTISMAPAMSARTLAREVALSAPSRPNKEELQKRCDRDEAAACYQLAALHAEGKELPLDHVASARLHDTACKGGVAAACGDLGVQYLYGQGVEKNLARALELFRSGCDGGVSNACRNLALCFAHGIGVDTDATAAAALYEKACAAEDPLSCTDLGRHLALGWGVPKDLARAIKLYDRACRAGYSAGCSNLGKAYRHGTGIAKDLVRATELFEKACSDGASFACGELGSMLLDGEGQARDPTRAAKLLEQACRDKQRASCTGLGTMYLEGQGVPKDVELAATWFERGCENGEPSSCFQLAGLHERGEGVALDRKRAAHLLRRACAAGLGGPSCDALP